MSPNAVEYIKLSAVICAALAVLGGSLVGGVLVFAVVVVAVAIDDYFARRTRKG